MDSYDPNLIFDLAAGNLPEAEARAAEAALTADGRAELEAQRFMLSAIGDAPPVGMTDIERAHLHRAVAAELADTTRELSPARMATGPTPARPRRSVAWMRWASAATAAAMFVGVVAVASQLGSLGGSDDSADTIATAAADLTTTTAAGGAADGAVSATTALSMSAGGGDFSDDVGENLDPSFEAVPEGSAEQLLEAPALSRNADKDDLQEVTAWLLDTRRDATLLEPIDDLSSLPCYAVALEDDDLAISDGFSVEYVAPDGRTLFGIGYADAGTETSDPLIRIYDLATCDPVVASTD